MPNRTTHAYRGGAQDHGSSESWKMRRRHKETPGRVVRNRRFEELDLREFAGFLGFQSHADEPDETTDGRFLDELMDEAIAWLAQEDAAQADTSTESDNYDTSEHDYPSTPKWLQMTLVNLGIDTTPPLKRPVQIDPLDPTEALDRETPDFVGYRVTDRP